MFVDRSSTHTSLSSPFCGNKPRTCDCPTTWVSLDERDNDLFTFLTYFVATIQRTDFKTFLTDIYFLLGFCLAVILTWRLANLTADEVRRKSNDRSHTMVDRLLPGLIQDTEPRQPDPNPGP